MNIYSICVGMIAILLTVITVVSSRYITDCTESGQTYNILGSEMHVKCKEHSLAKRYIPVETTTPKLEIVKDDVKIEKVKEKIVLPCTISYCAYHHRD